MDLVTPLCTQLTYEGLIDEVFGIKNGVVQLELGAEGASYRAECSPARSVHAFAGSFPVAYHMLQLLYPPDTVTHE